MVTKDEKAVERAVEDAPFEVPPFNEKDFIRKELVSFRTTVILFAFSVVVALASFFLWKGWADDQRRMFFLPLTIGVVGGGLVILRVLLKALKVDIGQWTRREWLGTGALYFFFWLGFFLLLVNPPLTDAAQPRVEVGVVPGVQAPGHAVQMGAFLADNVGIRPESVIFCIHRFEGPSPPAYASLNTTETAACRTEWTQHDGGTFRNHSFLPPQPGKYLLHVEATDRSGQATSVQHVVEAANPFTGVSLPGGGEFETVTEAMAVRVHPTIKDRVLVVQFSIDHGGNWSNFIPEPEAAKAQNGWWKTDPMYKGWRTGTHSLLLRAEMKPEYLGNNPRFAVPFDAPKARQYAFDAGGPYNVTVPDTFGSVGTLDPPTVQEPVFRPTGRTPGLGLPLALAATLAVLLLLRRRSPDDRA